MRFWKSTEEKAETARTDAFADYRPRQRVAATAGDSVVTGGGSVGPFLRRFYRNQVAVSGPVRRFLFFLLLAGVIYAFVLGEGGAIRIAMLRHERATLDRRIAELESSAALLDTEIARLESDPFHIEKTGRERYGYIREGDRVYKIVTPEDGKKQDDSR